MYDRIADIMNTCRRCVVLTGAGISAESGVPTFRGMDGLWNKYRPEQLATMEAFQADSKLVWEWYNWRRGLIEKVEPNPGHHSLVEMEAALADYTLVTQNVDGLHRRAGSKQVVELHGNIHSSKCARCQAVAEYGLKVDPENIPACSHCGGRIRPDVVWFGESLDGEVIEAAFKAAESADLFFSIGTSAIVHPAASLPVTAKRAGATLVEINPDRTPLTDMADFYIQANSGEVLPEIMKAYHRCREAGETS